MQKFYTNLTYKNRKEKQKYVWHKYKSILKGKILDVGADKGHLGKYIKNKHTYKTAGLEPHHQIKANFEEPLPIKSMTYDCVLCLDVLEHIENIHQLFDELCRVTKKYLLLKTVIIH
jgi:2-polyprenyl-3-methyl-5-hydroxy-6-metoxy-1,4-benzoquinol methylase